MHYHFLCTPVTECLLFFFFNDTATTEIYTLSLHDALPICVDTVRVKGYAGVSQGCQGTCSQAAGTIWLPSLFQTVIASTGQASHARNKRSRSTTSGFTNIAVPLSSSTNASGASVMQSPNPTQS